MHFCDEFGLMMKKEDGMMVCSNRGYEAKQEGDSEDFISTVTTISVTVSDNDLRTI